MDFLFIALCSIAVRSQSNLSEHFKGGSSILSSGSQWLRWDPHVHAPGTRFNDPFKGDWEGYLTALETVDPPIHAIGVTDCYGFDTYKQMSAHKQVGRLKECSLIFPNV